MYAFLSVHNSRSAEKNYRNILIIMLITESLVKQYGYPTTSGSADCAQRSGNCFFEFLTSPLMARDGKEWVFTLRKSCVFISLSYKIYTFL